MTKLKAGFWIRFLAGFIDTFAFLLSAYLLSISVVSQEIKIIPWAYYTWIATMSLTIIILQIVVPMFNKSRMTLGRWICRLEIQTSKHQIPSLREMIKKEIIYSILWIFCFLIFILFISPELFEKIAKSTDFNIKESKKFTNIEIFIISIPVSLISFLNFFQFILTLSIIRQSHISFNDYFSNTKTVWKNKYFQEKYEQKIHSLPRELPKLEWLN